MAEDHREVSKQEDEEEEADFSGKLEVLCWTDWYRDYGREEMDGQADTRKSPPVYVEEQESGSEYIKGPY